MKCKKSDGTIYTATWKLFGPQCPKINQFCNARALAYLPAISCCQLGLS